MQVGNYFANVVTETKVIFPVTAAGKRIRVELPRHYLSLTHGVTKDTVVFKYHRHQKKWLWNDSRMKGPVPMSHVREEVGRMLGDHVAARQIVAAAAAGLSI